MIALWRRLGSAETPPAGAKRWQALADDFRLG
jgi:hypothetical protein